MAAAAVASAQSFLFARCGAVDDAHEVEGMEWNGTKLEPEVRLELKLKLKLEPKPEPELREAGATSGATPTQTVARRSPKQN